MHISKWSRTHYYYYARRVLRAIPGFLAHSRTTRSPSVSCDTSYYCVAEENPIVLLRCNTAVTIVFFFFFSFTTPFVILFNILISYLIMYFTRIDFIIIFATHRTGACGYDDGTSSSAQTLQNYRRDNIVHNIIITMVHVRLRLRFFFFRF